jgi:hypothetical protein
MLARLVPERLRPKVAQLLQKRRSEDVYPTHYRANTVAALARAAEAEHFRVVDVRTINSSPQLYRVAGVRWLEELFLKALSHKNLEFWRPCVIALFVKEDQPSPTR